MLIIITGVSGSGKSEYAEHICCQLSDGRKKYYIATMQPYGEEGKKRILRHHKLRRGKGFYTIEQYQHIDEAAGKIQYQHKTDKTVDGTQYHADNLEINNDKPMVLLECMSNLLANECFEKGGNPDNIPDECMKLYSVCEHLVIVTNEVFSDGCEYDDDTRDYIKRLGELNIQLACKADVVVEVVYSIPVFHKGENILKKYTDSDCNVMDERKEKEEEKK